MHLRTWLSFCILSVFLLSFHFETKADQQAPAPSPTDKAYLIDGNNEIYVDNRTNGLGRQIVVLSQQNPITGFSLNPGGTRVAFCAPLGNTGQWGIWEAFTEVNPNQQEQQNTLTGKPSSMWGQFYRVPLYRPSLLWEAPIGSSLIGPIWWSPTGTQFIVHIVADRKSELLNIQGRDGITHLTSGKIKTLAWSPNGSQVAYVKEGAVWLQRIPPAKERRLGPGGVNLHWSTDGKTLSWITPKEGTVWTNYVWKMEQQKLEQVGPSPARPAGTVWSPDGHLCTVINDTSTAQGRLMVYPTASNSGEAIPLAGMQPKQILGWTPDSHCVLVLTKDNLTVMASVLGESFVEIPFLQHIKERGGNYQELRCAVVGPAIDLKAGLPSFSNDYTALSYVARLEESDTSKPMGGNVATKAGVSHNRPAATSPREQSSGLIVIRMSRRQTPHYNSLKEIEAEAEQARVTFNVKIIASALTHYLQNNGTFPKVDSASELREALKDNVIGTDVFVLPDKRPITIKSLIPADFNPENVPDPSLVPMFAFEDKKYKINIVFYLDLHWVILPKNVHY